MKHLCKARMRSFYRIVSGLPGTALVLNMPVASALTQKNITVGRGVTIYVDDQKINPGDANGNPAEAYSVPNALQSKIRQHATTDLAITNL